MPDVLGVTIGFANQYRDKRYDEEAGIDVCYEVRLAVRSVGEDGLRQVVSRIVT